MDDPTNEHEEGYLLYNHKEREQTLSIEEQLIKLCTFAGFVETVARGQFFMTKNDDEFLD